MRTGHGALFELAGLGVAEAVAHLMVKPFIRALIRSSA
jgi:hypothetical protein